MAGNKVVICGVNTSKLPLLSEEEKRALFVRMNAGDKSAREEFIRGNHLAVVLDAQLVGKFLSVIGFVEFVVIETNRERFIGHEACGDVA